MRSIVRDRHAVRFSGPVVTPRQLQLPRTPALLAPIRVTHTPRNGFDYPEGPKVDQYYPQFYHKTDKDGRPVYIEQMGKLDINALYKLTTQERQLKHLVHEYELFLGDRLPACSAQTGTLVETSCTILDLYNAGISTFYKGEQQPGPQNSN